MWVTDVHACGECDVAPKTSAMPITRQAGFTFRGIAAAAVTLVAACPNRSWSQQISGRINVGVEATVEHAVRIRLIDSTNVVVDSAVTRGNAVYNLQSKFPGTFRIVFRALGYAARDTTVRLERGQVLTVNASLAALTLASFEVRARSRCAGVFAQSTRLQELFGRLSELTTAAKSFVDTTSLSVVAIVNGAWREHSRNPNTTQTDSVLWNQSLREWPKLWSSVIVTGKSNTSTNRELLVPTLANSEIDVDTSCPSLEIGADGTDGISVGARSLADRSRTWLVVYRMDVANRIIRAAFLETSLSARTPPPCTTTGSRLAPCPSIPSIEPPAGSITYGEIAPDVYIPRAISIEYAETRRFVREAFRVRGQSSRAEQCFGGMDCAVVGVGLAESFFVRARLLASSVSAQPSSSEHLVLVTGLRGETVPRLTVRFTRDNTVYTSDSLGVIYARSRPDRVLHASCDARSTRVHGLRRPTDVFGGYVLIVDRC